MLLNHGSDWGWSLFGAGIPLWFLQSWPGGLPLIAETHSWSNHAKCMSRMLPDATTTTLLAPRWWLLWCNWPISLVTKSIRPSTKSELDLLPVKFKWKVVKEPRGTDKAASLSYTVSSLSSSSSLPLFWGLGSFPDSERIFSGIAAQRPPENELFKRPPKPCSACTNFTWWRKVSNAR